MLAGDERAHVYAVLIARADFYFACLVGEQPDQRVPGTADRNHGPDRHAALARGAISTADQRVGGELEIRVAQHHGVLLRPAKGLAWFARAAAGFEDGP